MEDSFEEHTSLTTTNKTVPKTQNMRPIAYPKNKKTTYCICQKYEVAPRAGFGIKA
jgi:hypothetical protein